MSEFDAPLPPSSQVNKEKVNFEHSLKSLQVRYDQLSKQYDEAVEQIKEEKRLSTSSREGEEFAGTYMYYTY